MPYPQFLKKGDKVAIVSTARKITLAEIQATIDFLNENGFVPVVGSTIGLADNQFAGNDDQRAKDFQTQLDNEEIKAIWCARGGYGTVRIIDKLNFDKFKTQPKWICGYSDITVLHSYIHQRFSIPTLHCLMPINLNDETNRGKVNESLASMFKVLKGEKMEYHFAPNSLNKNGIATAEIVGGNLSMLHTLAATDCDINCDGKILFLEDLDEYLYHIDRMLMQLKRSGKLKNLAALLVGDMSDMKDNTLPFGKSAYEIIAEHTAEYNYPVGFNFAAGHEPLNLAIPFGVEMSLSISNDECVLQSLVIPNIRET